MSIPSVIEGEGSKERAYDVFTRLLKDRIVFIGQSFSTDLANAIIGQLLFLESDDPDKDIIVYINSPGGAVSACLAIYDTMNYIKPDISTICVGQAYSAAAFLLASGTKGKRYALKNARIMMHQVSGGAEGSVQDVRVLIKEMERLNELMMSEYSCFLGKSVKQIKKDMDRDYFMGAEEAKNYGLVDHVLKSRER